MLKTEGVLHFTIPVKDLDRSEKFYTEILGMEKIRRTGHMVFLRAAGRDNFVLTFSEKPIDPNPAGKHEIHSAFRLTAEEYDKREGVPGVERASRCSRKRIAAPARSRAAAPISSIPTAT